MPDPIQLWSDDRIWRALDVHADDEHIWLCDADRLFRKMRDEYEHYIAAQTARIEALEAQLAAAQHEPVTIDDRPHLISKAQFRGIEELGYAICRRVQATGGSDEHPR